MINRRLLMTGMAGTALTAGYSRSSVSEAGTAQPQELKFGPREEFSFEKLIGIAKRSAAKPYEPRESPYNSILQKIDYDQVQKIKFRKDRSLRLDAGGKLPVQFFHLSKLFVAPVRIHQVAEGASHEILYSSDLFDSPDGHPARALPEGIGFAGFRVMAPDLETDWLANLGAAYFRTSGPYNQYGLSARGLAINTGLPEGEEFPNFTEYFLEGGDSSDRRQSLNVYALLESKSVMGAYKFAIARDADDRGIYRVVMDIEAQLFARLDVRRLGIAPFSSMFWYGEASRKQASDWRPEIHDSDGLAIWSGSGERIWRPLNNPSVTMTSTFIDRDPKGFGLQQRDRDFVHYLDDGVFYERRPTAWVEPLDPWGEGSVHLLEIPTDDEIHDNIAAYWCPAAPFWAGDSRRFRYRLRWVDDIPFPASLARATGTWSGLGGRPGHKRPEGVRKFVIDFEGPVFNGLGRDDGVELVITASQGTISNSYSHPVEDQRGRWRALFDIEAHPGPQPVDIRAYLKRGQQALTETWLYQYFPGLS